MSDVVIVVARTEADPSVKAAHGTSLFLVEAAKHAGFSKGTPLDKMGLKAQDTCELFFEDVVLDESALLGELNKGFYYLMGELPQERLQVGGARRAVSSSVSSSVRRFRRGLRSSRVEPCRAADPVSSSARLEPSRGRRLFSCSFFFFFVPRASPRRERVQRGWGGPSSADWPSRPRTGHHAPPPV